MKILVILGILVQTLFPFTNKLHAQNIYELRKFTEDEWLSLSTDERLSALSTGIKHTPNQEFLGNFGRNYDLYQKWGYEFYEMEDRYENYGFRGYENYNLINERRKRWSYNEFGDRITKMASSGRIFEEVHSGDGTFGARYAGWYFNQGSGVDGVMVARESTNDWAVSVISAGSLRKQFSPLSLSIPNMEGIAIDFQSANTSISTLSSTPFYDWDSNLTDKFKAVFIRGANIRRKLGVLTVGATYANQYAADGTRVKGDNWFGTVNNFTPTPIVAAIRFLDDSPSDNMGGPVIYDVRLKINGGYRDDIQPQIFIDNIALEKTTAVTSNRSIYYLDPEASSSWGYGTPPRFDLLNTMETIPKYIDYMLFNNSIRGQNLRTIKDNFNPDLAESYYTFSGKGNKPLQVNGTEMATYLFDLGSITNKVNRIEAVVTVANDYRIQTATFFMKQGAGYHEPGGEIASYNAQYWRTMAQADGNIKDGSNIRTLSIDFGYQVASLNYGFNADFNYRGFKMRGEFVTNSSHYMFADGVPGTGRPPYTLSLLPARTGHKWTQQDNAYYITAQKDWEKFGFTGELFKMGKFYRPWLDYFFGNIGNYVPHSNKVEIRNSYVRIPLILDNDDNDKFPDTDYVNHQSFYRQSNIDDPDGVFPGNDEDNDGVPDNNKNQNTIPDYLEPFLMFDSIPDEFVFGDDFNNNAIPDFREDDMKMDTPYDLDRQGYHYFFRFTPQSSVNLIAGSLRTGGVGLNNRTWDDYLKFQINYDVFDVGKINAEYRYEEIQDNIHDPFIKVSTIEIANRGSEFARMQHLYERELYYDELEYRNSKVNRLYLDSRLRAVPSITLENLMKFEKNKQIEGYTYDKVYQPKDAINTFAMVNKIVYTKDFGNFIFSPGINLRFYKKARSESVQPLDHYLMSIPLVMFKYIVSPQSNITLGLQGIPGFELSFKDYVQTENDYKRKTYTLEFANRSVYFGYDVWASVGINFDQLKYDEKYRDFENYKKSSTFLKIFMGW